MSLLIKALKKAEQSKDAKAEASSSSSGLTLELAPIEGKPQVITPSLAEEAGLPAPAKQQKTAPEAEAMPLSDTSKSEQTPSATPEIADTRVQDDMAASLMEESGFSLSEEAGFAELPIKTTKAATATKTEKPVKPIKSPVQEASPEAPTISASASAPASSGEQRQAAINLLTTRKDQKRSAGSRRRLYLGLAGLFLLLGLGGGFYYYLQTLDQTQLVAMQPPRGPVPPTALAVKIVTPQVAPQPVLAEVKPASAAPTAISNLPLPGESSAKITDKIAEASAAPEEPMEQVVVSKPKSVTKSGSSKEPMRKSMGARRQAMTDEDSPLKVSRMNKGKPTVDATQVAAYQAFQAGDDATAGQLYQQLSQSDPRNVDALLGLAAVAARQDHADEAVSDYQRVLELDPNNSVAQEGLIVMSGQTNPTESASKLKTMIAQQPNSAHLYAALGGIYADQNQWPDAQQAYFQAFNLDTDNAEYAFNLAISLDHLKKPDIALNYYQQALALLGKQSGSIDKKALQNRINELRDATGR
jgi:tetratricopeptide (TPR) repeat protein